MSETELAFMSDASAPADVTVRGIRDKACKFLPCPFCGNSSLSFVDILDFGAMHYSVTCDDCEVTMIDVDILSLLRTWNRRVGMYE